MVPLAPSAAFTRRAIDHADATIERKCPRRRRGDGGNLSLRNTGSSRCDHRALPPTSASVI